MTNTQYVIITSLLPRLTGLELRDLQRWIDSILVARALDGIPPHERRERDPEKEVPIAYLEAPRVGKRA